MCPIYDSAMAIAKASKGNPIYSTLTVMLFYIMFNITEAQFERLIFGECFEHWLDPVFNLAFIAFAAFSVCACAIYNTKSA